MLNQHESKEKDSVRPKLYLETSIISYLTARPSRDLLVAANQQITHDWWDNRREHFDVYSSQLVIQLELQTYRKCRNPKKACYRKL